MYMNLKPNKNKRISFNTMTMASLGFMNTDGVAALHRLSSLLWLIIKKNFEAGKIAFPYSLANISQQLSFSLLPSEHSRYLLTQNQQ